MTEMTPNVQRTSSGNGALITVTESKEEIKARQQRRRAHARDEAARLQFTTGQMKKLRRRQAS